MSHRGCSQSVGVGALKTRPALAMTDSHARCTPHTPHQPPLSLSLSLTHTESPLVPAQWISTLFSVPSAWFSWLEPI